MSTLLADPGTPTRARQSHPPGSAGAAGFAAVLRELERGVTADRVAARLGLPDELVALALDHAERIGLVVRSCGPAGGGCPTGPARPTACAGCPLAR